MEKVYIVTSGEYSDYQINAVFSTREKAEECVDIQGTGYRIEEFPIDEPMERKERIWRVFIDCLSGEIENAYPTDSYEDKIDTVQFGSGFHESTVYIILKSDSLERVKKVASERFMQVKALLAVKFPFLTTECVINRRFGSFRKEYPFYDYYTGKIVLDQYMELTPGFDAPVEYRKETDNQ